MLNNDLEIIKYPHEILTKPSEDIDILGPQRSELVQWINKFYKFYKDYKSDPKWGNMVGLAAPQVGKNWNIFCAFDQVFINPKVIYNPLKGSSIEQEGCYSLIEGKYDYKVKRFYNVKMTWLDVNGEEHRKNFWGRDAQIIQHEIDHLLGKLCHD